MKYILTCFLFFFLYQAYSQETVSIGGREGVQLALGIDKSSSLKRIKSKGYSSVEDVDDFVQVIAADGETVANLEFRENRLRNVNLVWNSSEDIEVNRFITRLLAVFKDAIDRGIKQPTVTIQQMDQKGIKSDVLMIQYHKGNITIMQTRLADGTAETIVTQQVNTPSKGY